LSPRTLSNDSRRSGCAPGSTVAGTPRITTRAESGFEPRGRPHGAARLTRTGDLAIDPVLGHTECVARELTRLGEALRAALSRLPAGPELASFPIWTEWADVVGVTIARHARPRRLRRGVLLVEVDGAEWMHELQYLKADLRTRLNERLGRSAVREIFLALAGAGDDARSSRRA
jgi:Dna[CI] antecedent, DciA